MNGKIKILAAGLCLLVLTATSHAAPVGPSPLPPIVKQEAPGATVAAAPPSAPAPTAEPPSANAPSGGKAPVRKNPGSTTAAPSTEPPPAPAEPPAELARPASPPPENPPPAGNVPEIAAPKPPTAPKPPAPPKPPATVPKPAVQTPTVSDKSADPRAVARERKEREKRERKAQKEREKLERQRKKQAEKERRRREKDKGKDNKRDDSLPGDQIFINARETAPFFPQSKVNDLLKTARSYIGVPYVYGGTTPKGFDCSGYVQFVFKKYGFTLPRTADDQFQVGRRVKTQRELVPGDLVFFATERRGEISHCGVFLGSGQFIHASSSKGIRIDRLDNEYWKPRYAGGKNVVKK